jgi:hypothetical protein
MEKQQNFATQFLFYAMLFRVGFGKMFVSGFASRPSSCTYAAMTRTAPCEKVCCVECRARQNPFSMFAIDFPRRSSFSFTKKMNYFPLHRMEINLKNAFFIAPKYTQYTLFIIILITFCVSMWMFVQV